jgi:hypothetical protein
MSFAESPATSVEFVVTQEYLLFAEFRDACREARYIGLCYSVPGVGKTVSARQCGTLVVIQFRSAGVRRRLPSPLHGASRSAAQSGSLHQARL